MTKQMSNEASAHELVFGSVWPTDRNCTSGISRANECAADNLLLMLGVARLFQPYQADVIKFACLCCFRCGRTARKESCDGECNGYENRTSRDDFRDP